MDDGVNAPVPASNASGYSGYGGDHGEYEDEEYSGEAEAAQMLLAHLEMMAGGDGSDVTYGVNETAAGAAAAAGGGEGRLRADVPWSP